MHPDYDQHRWKHFFSRLYLPKVALIAINYNAGKVGGGEAGKGKAKGRTIDVVPICLLPNTNLVANVESHGFN